MSNDCKMMNSLLGHKIYCISVRMFCDAQCHMMNTRVLVSVNHARLFASHRHQCIVQCYVYYALCAVLVVVGNKRSSITSTLVVHY